MIFKIVQVVCWVLAFYAVSQNDYAQANFLMSIALYTLFYSVAKAVDENEES